MKRFATRFPFVLLLVACGEDETPRDFDVLVSRLDRAGISRFNGSTGERVGEYEAAEVPSADRGPSDLLITPSNTLVVSAFSGTIDEFDIATGALVRAEIGTSFDVNGPSNFSYARANSFCEMSLGPSARFLYASRCGGPGIALIDFELGTFIDLLARSIESPGPHAWTPDGRLLVADGTAGLFWVTRDSVELFVRTDGQEVNDMILAQDGTLRVALGSGVRTYSLDGTLLGEVFDEDLPVTVLSQAPNGDFYYSSYLMFTAEEGLRNARILRRFRQDIQDFVVVPISAFE